MNGLKVGAPADRPTYVPRKTAERDVVMPGFTGLPSVPMKPTSIARTLSRASRPPTMCPRGQVSWNSTRSRGAPVDAGTTTHGPATGTQTMSPSHSFAPPAGAATASAAAGDDDRAERAHALHGTLLKRNTEVVAAMSRSTASDAPRTRR